MIFYFSATGNTLWAVKTLAKQLDERLIDMAKDGQRTSPIQLSRGERLGFCFPVHGWKLPRLVREYIENLTLIATERPYTWALCTAGDSIGQTFEIFNKRLKNSICLIDGEQTRLPLRLQACFSLIMPESYVGLPFMDVDRKEKERAKVEKARKLLPDIAETVRNRTEGVTQTTKGAMPRTMSYVLGSFFHQHLVTDKPFQVDNELCLRCGKCANTCPVGNIEWMSHQTPRWIHSGRCLSCFSCYHHCPAHAISYGHRTRGKGQYYFKELSDSQ